MPQPKNKGPDIQLNSLEHVKSYTKNALRNPIRRALPLELWEDCIQEAYLAAIEHDFSRRWVGKAINHYVHQQVYFYNTRPLLKTPLCDYANTLSD